MSDVYDLIVIGAGSGGVAASRRAAGHGAKVLLVEADRVGGTCVLNGCVPKKLMMYAAGYAQAFDEAAGYGWTDLAGRFELSSWADAKVRELERLEGIYRQLLASSGVELLHGRARLTAADTVEVDGRSLKAHRVLVATGGYPVRDALPGLERAMTSDDVLQLRELPESLLVIGGGYIAVEFASIFAGLGAKVTIAYRDTLPLRGFDRDLRQRLATLFAERGIVVAAGVDLKSVEQEAGRFVLHRADGTRCSATAALNATGRRPKTADLGLEAAGVRINARGAIAVDADSRSSVPGIWAVGDVTDRINLTPVAIAEGRAFADSEFGGQRVRMDHRQVASAVFTEPPIACIGLTEADAARHGPVDIYESDFRPMRTAFIGSPMRSYMKLVVDGRSDKVLGIHMIGSDAPEMMQCLAVAMTCGATKRDFDRTVAVHPTAAEEFVLMREPTRRLSPPALTE